MSDKELPNINEAIEQLAEFFGFDAHYDFQVDGEPYRITYRQFLPADVREAVDQIDLDIEKCDRAEAVVGGRVIKSAGPAIPLRKDGALLKYGRDAQCLIAMWGQERFDKFVKAGGPPDMLTVVWAKMDADYEAWRKTGSKSAAGN